MEQNSLVKLTPHDYEDLEMQLKYFTEKFLGRGHLPMGRVILSLTIGSLFWVPSWANYIMDGATNSGLLRPKVVYLSQNCRDKIHL